MSDIKISIIVPVYNAGEFLKEAMDSMINQSLAEIEIIAVNDGSTDNSQEILEDYASRDSRIMVISQDNAGPSAARNQGLEVAKGEFVYFLDGDDFLDVDSMQALYERAVAKKADLVIGKYDIYNGIVFSNISNIIPLIRKDVIEKYDQGILWTFTLSNKLFKRSIIEQEHFRFAPVSYSEDGIFTMNYVYHSSMITGLDKVIFHYRRVPFARHTSITSSVSEAKIRDYLAAHQMIFCHMKESIIRDFPEYHSFEEILRNEEEMSQYVSVFRKKELNILFNQFYKKFWTIEESTIAFLEREIRKLLEEVNLDIFYQLAAAHAELDIDRLYRSYADAIESCRVTIAVFDQIQDEKIFLETIQSLYFQTLIPYEVIVPARLRPMLQKANAIYANMQFAEGTSRMSFYRNCLEQSRSPYIILSDNAFSYQNEALGRMYLNMRKNDVDVLDSLIFFKINDRAVSSSSHEKLIRKMENRRKIEDSYTYDSLLANKMIRTEFARKWLMGENEADAVFSLMQNAYYMVSQKTNIIFEVGNMDFEFRTYLNSITGKILSEQESISPTSLADPRTDRDMIEVFRKLRSTNVGKSQKNKRNLLYKIGKLPTQNKVLFYSIRKENELEANMKAVYDRVNGKKVVCSKMLPHSGLWKFRMYYEFATSKVIVVDDYARYLRLFPLKPDQKVVQLWHACGAFKMFGKHGTNLSMPVEVATHMQYNMVCVSAEGVRPTYASAFDIDMNKISALGVPRTDLYFDDEAIRLKREMIYRKYPQLKGKRVYLYAPTFRDKNAKRDTFEPEIDFDDLSRRLPKDVFLLIGPHPVMTVPILKKTYPNILEIRDVSSGDMMFISDLLITDYSSVIFEFSLLNKPIVFYCYDKKFYNRGFYLDFDKDLPGELIENYEDFVEYLCDPKKQILTEKHARFVEKYMSACDGNSSDRIANVINQYLIGDRKK